MRRLLRTSTTTIGCPTLLFQSVNIKNN